MTERTIGQLARDSGFGIETIRYYQRIGLIPKPQRAFNGWRRYPERTLALLQVVRQGRQLGFRLRELRGMLGQFVPGAPCVCADFRAAIAAKVAELDARIAAMQTHRAQLCDLMQACAAHGAPARCAIVESLA